MNIRLLPAVLAFSTATARAQDATPERDADRAALRALAATYETAINKGDLSGLADSLLPEASAVFLTGDECRGLPAMQAFYDGIKQKLGEGTRYTVKLHADTTNFYGNVAVGHGTCDEQVIPGAGGEFTYQTKWTAVLQKSGDRWLASRLHVSLDPIDNPIIAARTRMAGWVKLGAGALGGLLLGFLLGRRKRLA